MSIQFTKMSSRGQVVIPKNVRENLKLKEGTPFVIAINDNTICLKRIELPNASEWEKATKNFKDAARKSGFRQEDLFAILNELRKKR